MSKSKHYTPGKSRGKGWGRLLPVKKAVKGRVKYSAYLAAEITNGQHAGAHLAKLYRYFAFAAGISLR